MNIQQFELSLTPDGKRMLEDLHFEALRSALDDRKSLIEAAEDPEDRAAFMVDREHFLDLRRALINSDYTDGDTLVDWSQIDRVRAERQQMGEAPAAVEPELLVAQPTPKRAGFDPSRRPGRPHKYRWKDFAAEMTRRCMAGPITNQAALERHMAEWCAETFGEGNEPSPSQIRDWVSATFSKIRPQSSGENTVQELRATAL